MITPAKLLPAAAIAGALALASAAGAQSADPHAGHGPATAGTSQKPGPLTDRVREAIGEALQDERRGEAMYARVLKDHGEVRPFSNVVCAERRHSALLEELLKARGLAVPARPAGAEPPAYATVKEACAAAVEFETQNVALYDRLLAAGSLPDDVKGAFDHNRVASLDRHKPAFERCAGLATVQGSGHRAGRGAGDGGGHGQCRGPRGGGPCGGHGQGHEASGKS